MIQFEPGEQVITQVRQHWFVFVAQSLGFVVLTALPALIFFVPEFLAPLGISFSFGPVSLFFAATWWLLLWIIFAIVWTNYYLDLWIVTTKRIIDIEQHSLFSREISECRLDRVQDITAEVVGVLPTMLNYGNVYIQTAAEAERFEMKNIPDPNGMKDLIFEQHPPIMRE